MPPTSAPQTAYEHTTGGSGDESAALERRSVPEVLLDEIEAKIDDYRASIARFKKNQEHLETLRKSQDFSDAEVQVFADSIHTDQLVVTTFANDVKMMSESAQQAWNRRSRIMRELHKQGHLREDVAQLWGDNQRQLGKRLEAIRDQLLELGIPA